MEIDYRPDKKFTEVLLLGTQGKQGAGVEGWAGSLSGLRVTLCPGDGWFAHPLNGTVAVGHVHLTFAPGSSKVVVEFFLSLCVFCPEFALTAACIQLFLVREGNGTPLQYSCLENPMDGGAW